jgi:Protein of unknown function (DUF669)
VAKKIKIDFSGVDHEIRSGGRAAHVPEGDYLAKPVNAELRKSEKSGSRYISWRFQVVEPKKYKGKTLYDRTSLKPDALWNLRNLVHAALGKNIAGKVVNFDPEVVYGKPLMITVEDDEYEGKIRSQIVDYQPKAKYEEGDDDEDEEGEDDDEEEEEEEDEEEDEDLDDVDVEEL